MTERQADYAGQVAAALERRGLRVAIDAGPHRLPRKIVAAHEAAIPVLLAVGDREERAGTVALRRIAGGAGRDAPEPEILGLADAVDRLAADGAIA